MSKQKITHYSASGRLRDTSKPLPLDITDRTLSAQIMPPGRNTCNAKLTSRDGYCKQPGVVEFARCAHHGGKKELAAFDIFSKSLNLGNALKMQSLIDDTLSMDNELAASKVLLTQTLDDWTRAHTVKQEYMDHPPALPDLDEVTSEDKELLKKSLALHKQMLEIATETENTAYVRAERLTKILVDGVAKNKKITDGAKFTMDIKQIRGILKIQLEVMAVNCSGCSKLRDVIKMMREKANDIMIDPKLSKASRKAMGSKRYAQELEKVEQIGDAMGEGVFTDL